ncbi:MAG: hypothetical protein AAF291_03310 [Pseudomonadota bacterium]
MGSVIQLYEWLFDAARPAPMDARQANRLLGAIALALLAFTVIAFGAKAAAVPEVRARYTPLVVFHAGSMLAWMGLLAGQAYLASAGRMGLHRRFGTASLGLVAAMTVSGAILSINIGQELGRPEVTVVNLVAFITFIPLYVFAIHSARTHRVHWHRQAMLIGTLAFMTPVYARITDVLGLPPQVAIGVQPPLTFAIALGYEWAALGRITKATAVMLGLSAAVIFAMVAVLAIWFV